MDAIATEVGTAYLSIVAATKGMTKDIRQAFGEAVGDGDVAGQKSGKGFVGGLGKTIAKGAAILGVGALVGTTISAGMQRAISIEGSQKKLEGLGHSAASITSIMDSALASVKGTAYGLGDAASVAAMMAAAGVENGDAMTRTLSTVADVAAISGRSLTDMGTIFGSVAARGKLQGDDMLQLMSSGIPVLQLLGKHLGKTSAEVSEMVTKGKIDFATFEAAMAAGMGGAAKKGAETFTGALANARAALGRLGAAFMSPALTAAKPLLVGFTGLIDGITSVVTPAANALGRLMVPAAERAGAALGRLGAKLGTVAGAGAELFDLFAKGDYTGGLSEKLGLEEDGRMVAVILSVRAAVVGLFDLFAKGDYNGILSRFLGIEEDSRIVGAILGIRSAAVGLATEGVGGFRAFASAWRAADGDVTSSGFPGFMEQAAYALRLFSWGLSGVADFGDDLTGPMSAIANAGYTIHKVFTEAAAGFRAFGAAWKAADGDVTSSGFPGFMERLAGALRTAWDAVTGFLEPFGGLRGVLAQVAPLLGMVAGPIGLFAKAALGLGPALRDAAAGGGSFGDILAGLVGNLATGAATMLENVAGLMAGLLPAVADAIAAALPKVLPVLVDAFGTIVETVATVLPQLITGWVGVISSVLPTLVPVVLEAAVTLLGALVDALGVILPAVLEGVVTLIGALVGMLPTLLPVLMEAAVGLFLAIVDALPLVVPMLIEGALSLLLSLVELLPQLVPVLLQAALSLFLAIVQALPLILEGLVGALTSVVTALAAMLPVFIPALVEAAVALFTALVDALPIILPQLIDGAVRLIHAVVDMLPVLIPALLTAAVALFTAIVNALPRIVPALVGAAARLIGTVVGMLPTLIPQLLGAALSLFMAIVRAVPQIVGALVGAVGSLIGAALRAVGSFGPAMLSAGRNLIQGFINGIRNMAGAIANAARSVVSGAVNGIKGFLGIRSPSRLLMELGGYTGEGFTIGLEAEADGVAKAAAKVARAAVPDVAFDPWDKALADLSANVTPPPLFVEPPAFARVAEPVGASEGVEALLLRLIGAVEAGQTINLDGRALVGATARNMSQTLSSAETGRGRAAGRGGLEV